MKRVLVPERLSLGWSVGQEMFSNQRMEEISSNFDLISFAGKYFIVSLGLIL